MAGPEAWWTEAGGGARSSAWAPRPRVDNATVKGLALAFQWRKMLDEGVCGAVDDLAKVERLAPSYISGILRLTLLAPELVEAILDGRQPSDLQLDDLLEGFRWSGSASQQCWQATIA